MDKNNSDAGRNFSKPLIISGKKQISYSKSSRDRIFSTILQKDEFYVNSLSTAEKRGIDIKNKLLLRFDEKTGDPIFLDNTNEYVYNSDGYRSKEFDGSAKLLYAGCSNTFGTGVPEDRIWGSMVANHFDLSYANLSKQGSSTHLIVKNIFAYFDKYGHPEVLCCLFPDFYRMILASNSNQLIYRNPHDKSPVTGFGTDSKLYEVHLHNAPNPGDTPEYSRRPHNVIDVIPADTAIYQSIQSILMLDQYCRANNIKFAWSTWEPAMLFFLTNIKSEYPQNYSNLVNLDLYNWVKNPDKKVAGDLFQKDADRYIKDSVSEIVDCHSELRAQYGDNFFRGLDDFHGIDKTHFGIHKHTHIAESYIKFLENN